jgi:hypothetical protein
MAGNRGFASKSVARHVTRGVIGFGAIVAAFALLPAFGLWSLLLAPVGLLALRGCPVCWILGLIETVSMGRLQRECVDGSCQLRGH